MIIVQHRRNTINLLKETPVKFGVEVDIRSYGDKLIIHHDPFINKDLLRRLDKRIQAQSISP